MKDLKEMRALVLGGSGFIGKSLCRALVSKEVEVRCYSLDNPFDDEYLSEAKAHIEWFQGDFSDQNSINRAVQDIDIIFHLICTTLPATSNIDLSNDLTSNVLPTLNILDTIKNFKKIKFIFISSGGTIYGITDKSPIPESHSTLPICGYGIHKLTIEKYLHLYEYLFGIDYIVLRVANPYGRNQISERPQGVIGNFLYKALCDKPIDIWGDGGTIRDYIYIDDVVNALISVINYSGPYKVFNIGSGKGYSLIDIISIIENILEIKIDVRFKPSRNVDLPVNILDISMAKTELNWIPKTKIEDGIKYLIQLPGLNL